LLQGQTKISHTNLVIIQNEKKIDEKKIGGELVENVQV
jgi:hypothetical protein